MNGRLPAYLGLMLILPVIVLFAPEALGQERIVVTQFENDEGRRFEDMIIDELLFRGDYQLVSYESFIDEVDTYDLTLDEFLDDPVLVVDLSEYFEYSAILRGRLDRERRPRELVVTVYEGASGLEMGRVTFGVRQGQLDDTEIDDRMIELEDLIDLAEPVNPPEPEPVARSDTRQRSTTPPATSEPTLTATEPPSRLGWLVVEAGLDIVQRSFSLESTDAGIQYDSGFYPGVEGIIEIYPVKLFKPGVVDGLGIQVRLARYFVDTVLVLDELGQDLDIPTRHKEFDIAAIYKHPFGRFELDGALGYSSLAFTLGDNTVYTSSEYRSVLLAVGGRYAIIRDLLSADLSVQIRPAPKLGDAEIEAFGQGSSFGFGLTLGVEVTPIERLSIAGSYRYLRFSNSYDGTGNGGLTGNIDGADSYNLLALRASWAF